MVDIDTLVVQLARNEIALDEALAQLQKMPLSDMHGQTGVRTQLQRACARAQVDADSTRALLQALDATRLQAVDDSQTQIISPASATHAPTVLDVDDTSADAGARSSPADPSGAPTRTNAGTDETAADAPTELTAAGASTASDWDHPDHWQQKHKGAIGVGTVLKERFVLQELLGRGGMGSVYRARDLRRVEAEDRETDVAIKLINEEFQQHPDAMVALQREAKKSQTLAHPNIVTVYDFDRDGATVYVSMAYLQGKPLDVLLRKTAPDTVPMKQGLDIIQQLANGLAYAHKKGFAHADFKPGNIFITDKGDARILDFGIARAATDAAIGADVSQDTSGKDDTRFDPTTLGAITPSYASLEMLQRQPPVPADDVYALACVAYEILTGRHPFLDENGAKLPAIKAAERKRKPAPVKGVPRRYQRAIQRGLAFKRADRYADASAFVNAIKAPTRIRRSVAAIALVLVVVAGVSWWYSYEQSDLAVTMQDLSLALKDSRALLQMGDQYLAAGNIAEAHKAYAQAWDNGRSMPKLNASELKQLRVLVDRRVDKVIGAVIASSQKTDLSGFQLRVLLLNMESMKRSKLGTRDGDLKGAIQRIEKRLSAAE